MYSVNAPVPGEVAALASELAVEIPAARERARGEHSLLVKRLGADDREAFHRRQAQVRDAVRGTAPFRVQVTGVDLFAEPTSGTGPVVYLAVESPGLLALHDRLCDAIDPVEDLEGEDYTPHVTIARGGDLDAARDLVERDLDPVSWEVTELVFWDARRSVPAGRLSLPI